MKLLKAKVFLFFYRNKQLNTPDYPCSEEYFTPLEECIDSYYERKIKCKLPWSSSFIDDLDDCTSEDLEKKLKPLHQNVSLYTETEVTKHTTCLFSCEFMR